MQCLKFPSVQTYLIIYNDEGLLTTALATPNDEVCTKSTNVVEQYTDKDEYIERCEELGIDPIVPPDSEEE